MGMKYMLSAFNYPFKGYSEVVKQTRYFIVCAFWFLVFSIKYDGVDIQMRGE